MAAYLVACDLPGCSQAYRSTVSRPGWLTVGRDDDLVSFSEGPGPWHFCSWAHLGRFGLLQRRVDEEGMVVSDDKGRPVAHPALAVERTYAAEVKRWVERYRPYPSRR